MRPRHQLHTANAQPCIKARDQLRSQLIPAEEPPRLVTVKRRQPRIRTLRHLGARLDPARTTNTVLIMQVQVGRCDYVPYLGLARQPKSTINS
jgi:hypothetical protein